MKITREVITMKFKVTKMISKVIKMMLNLKNDN